MRPRWCALRLTLILLAVTAAGCGSTPADTPTVLLAEGVAGDQAWRLEGRRALGKPCASLVLAGLDKPPIGRCGVERTELRHVDPVAVTVGDRLLVFSPLPAKARRVRFDSGDGTILVEPAGTAPGYPARFFIVDRDPSDPPLNVRAFGEGGRAVVT
jgi:hypothetical protein